MSIKQLVHPTQWAANLTVSATNTTFGVSYADSVVIEQMRLAYGGTVKMLIIKPPIESQPGSTLECINVTSVATGTGVCTTGAMTYEDKYLVTSGSQVYFNLIADGNMEYYGDASWAVNWETQYRYKSTEAYEGMYSLETYSASGNGYCTQTHITIAENDDYCFNVSYKLVSGTTGSTYFTWFDFNNSSNFYYTPLNSTANWKTWDGSFRVVSGASYLWPVLWSGGTEYSANFDNISLIKNLLANGSFEPCGRELIKNGNFEQGFTTGLANYFYEWGSGGNIYSDETSIKYAGSHSQKDICNYTVVGYAGIIQNISFTDNSIYYVSFYLYASLAGNYFSVGDGPTNWNKTIAINNINTWELKTHTFSQLSTYADNMRWGTANGSFTFYLDNISVKEVAGWQVSNATVDISSSNSRYASTPNYALGIISTINGGEVYQSITTINNQWYTFVGWGKSSTSGHRFKMQISGTNTNTMYYDSDWTDSTTYIKKGCTFKNIGDSSVKVLGIVETAGETVYFDDWYMVPLISTSTTESYTTMENSYNYGYCDDNAYGSILVDGSDTFCVGIQSGTHLNPNKGTIDLWYKPQNAFDDFMENAVIISGSGSNTRFLKVYYNSSDYKFYGEIYNGNEYVCSGCTSSTQSFVSGTWINIGFTYDNNVGSSLYIDGEIEGIFEGTWNQQILSDLMALGCISGSYGNRANGYLDDICFYTNSMPPDVFKLRYLEYHDMD